MANISQINGSLINAATASFALSASGSLIGSLSGTASWASNATTAITATSASTQLITTNADHYITFVDTNNVSPTSEKLGTVGNLTINPNTGTVKATSITSSFTGSLSGTASYATAASQSGYPIQFVLATSGSNPAANTAYRWGAAVTDLLNTTAGRRRIYVPRPGTVRYAHIYVRVNGTLATAGQTSTFRIEKNGSVSQLINTSTTAGSTADVAISSTALTMSVIQGDYLEIQWTTPSGWSTTPTAVECNAIIFIEQNS